MTPIIRTVCGDIPASELGVCYPHEHLFGAPPKHLSAPDFELDSFDAALEETKQFHNAGGRALVDMSTLDYNRDIQQLKRVSEASAVHIIAATGFNKDRFSKSIVDGLSDQGLDDLLFSDVTAGVDGTNIKAGLLKAASTKNTISKTAQRVFESVARVHKKTGVPVSTHTEAGTMALEQVTLLTNRGVDPARIIIGHLDRKLEWSFILDVAQTGVFMGFDQISKEKYFPDQLRVEIILKLIDHGHGGQILLSGDLARRSYWPGYGYKHAPGFTFILERFVPMLRAAGASDAHITDLIKHNPARALSVIPVSSATQNAG